MGAPHHTALPACHCRTGVCRSGFARNVKVDTIHGNMIHWARERAGVRIYFCNYLHKVGINIFEHIKYIGNVVTQRTITDC